MGDGPGPRRSRIRKYECRNPQCRWVKNGMPGFIVQVRDDGTIPDPVTKGPKSFPALTPDQEAWGRRITEEMAIHDPTLAAAVKRLEEEK